MSITDYTGKNLLQSGTIQSIKKEADLLLSKKEVALAWQASSHIKSELAKLDSASVKPVLSEYRTITTKLKALALPLLDASEVRNLIQNNLEFIDKSTEEYLVSGIRAWFATQPEEEQGTARDNIVQSIPKNNPIGDKIKSALQVGEFASGLEASGEESVNIQDKDKLFDEEESNELQKHAKKATEVGTAGLIVDNLDALAQEIFTISKSRENKELFLSRTRSLLKSRLRDVRTKVDLKEYFARPFAVGGLGLDGDILSQSLVLAENEYKEVHKEGKVQGSQPKAGQPLAERFKVQSEKSVSQEPEKKQVHQKIPAPKQKERVAIPKPQAKEPRIKVGEQKQGGQAEIDKLITQDAGKPFDLGSGYSKKRVQSAIKQIPPPPRRTGKPDTKQPVAVSKKPEVSVAKNRIVRPEKVDFGGKSRMQDIKHSSSVVEKPKIETVGLSDEFRLLNLGDFRKLGDAEAAVETLLQKLEVLAQESIKDKISAIKGLRSSELNHQYLAVGEASIGGAKKLADVLADKSVNPDNMSEDEFFAIANLNSRLK